MFIPLAKRICCALVSLRTTLLSIVVIDIMLSIAWIIIGAERFLRSKLSTVYAVESGVNGICLLLAIVCLVAIKKKKANLLRYYFIWKCIEIVIMPLISIVAIE